MDHVKSLLGKVLQKRGLQQEASAAHVTYLATLWIEKHLPGCCSALHVRAFREGALFIAADHAIAAQECMEAKIRLLEALQADCPSVQVRDILISRSV